MDKTFFVEVNITKFVVSRCGFCKLRRNFGSFCSVNHVSRPLRKQMFTCDWCISTLFVSVFQGSLLVIVLFRIVLGSDRLFFFEAFHDLSYSCLLQE